jgi:hypothetical protein
METYIDNYDAALEIAGDALADIVHLWHWSTNYDYTESPWCTFLNLIGYSEDTFGELIAAPQTVDFVTGDKLADALKLWATRPNDVYRVINAIAGIEND